MTSALKNVAIIGGGLGGLITARMLEDFPDGFVRATIFEASSRVGGKILTKSFNIAPILYEAGVAEIYDYSHIGPDPLKKLIGTLGLSTVEMMGSTVVLRDTVVSDLADIERYFGKKTKSQVDRFYRRCVKLYSPSDYYAENWQFDNNHEWSNRLFSEVLDEIGDEVAREYFLVSTRSDTATEPHATSALNGLKNVLMQDDRYIKLYSIQGGIGRLVDELERRCSANIEVNAPVVAIERQDGGYRVTTAQQNQHVVSDFDAVILTLPTNCLSSITWSGRELRRAMQGHISHYNYPAHYLRITALFERPFWRKWFTESYFLLDAFGGCCVYDEGVRYPAAPYGVLSWLLAGGDALTFANFDDQRLINIALNSLPTRFGSSQKHFLEGSVQRWLGTVSGEPGGRPIKDLRARHLPDHVHNPYLFTVGDYLFDSTLNAVVDSAEFATNSLLTNIRREQKLGINASRQKSLAVRNCKGSDFNGIDVVVNDYFDDYADESYEHSFYDYFCEHWTCDLIKAVWGWKPPYKLLDCGSASGLTLEAFAKKGVNAWGIENNEYIHAQTPKKWLSRNIRGDVRKMPFPDNAFDFIYETCLCYIPEEYIDDAIREIFRVCRIGVVCGSVATDMTDEIINWEGLFYGVRTFASMQEWNDFYVRNGFRLAVKKQNVLKKVWKIEQKANEGYTTWYPDAETMRFCFYSKEQQDLPKTRGRRRSAASAGGKIERAARS